MFLLTSLCLLFNNSRKVQCSWMFQHSFFQPIDAQKLSEKMKAQGTKCRSCHVNLKICL